MRHDPAGTHLVLSPHLDDAVLSAWSLLRGADDVTVVTVCAGVPAEGRLGRFDPVFGAADSAALVRSRRAEDVAALACAGRTAVHLDHLDVQYRDAPLDGARIAADVTAVVDGVASLWVTAGIGNHPDHLAVRDVAVELGRTHAIPLRLCADLPYAANFGWPHWVTGADPDPHLVPDATWADLLAEVSPREVLRAHAVALDDDEREAKLAALRCYESQFSALDGGPVGRLRNPAVLGFELWWEVPAPTDGGPRRARTAPSSGDEAIDRVAEANDAWWRAERALIDAYWTWEGRSIDTDLAWLARQCHKELRDGVVVRAAALHDALAPPSPSGWGELDRAVDGIATEHAHLRAFAAVHDAFAPRGTAPLTPAAAAGRGWPENDALMALRAEHRARHGHLGTRAFAITEGGGGALYASGAALHARGLHGPIDRAIAQACAAVADDEDEHRQEWLAELELRPEDLDLLVELSVAQSRARLRMRWAQFERPVPGAALDALEIDLGGAT